MPRVKNTLVFGDYWSNKSICSRKEIPENKTIVQYSIALEEAVFEMLKRRNNDNIVALLKDAAKHKKWPKNYISYDVEKFWLCDDYYVRRAKFYIKGGIRIVMRNPYFNITITPMSIKCSSQNRLTRDFRDRIYELQNTLRIIEELQAQSK